MRIYFVDLKIFVSRRVIQYDLLCSLDPSSPVSFVCKVRSSCATVIVVAYFYATELPIVARVVSVFTVLVRLLSVRVRT